MVAAVPRWRRSIGSATALAIFALVLAAVVARYGFRDAPAAPRLSIAVLPFRNFSNDPRQDSLAAAISLDLAADLARIPGSTVKPRKAGGEVEDIGRSAQVRYVLEGGLTIQGDMFNVNAELIDAENGRHICCDRFNVARDSLGADHEQIVRRIASMLNTKLIQIEAARSLVEHSSHPDALDYYLRARSALDRGNGLKSLTETQKLLEQAVNVAPALADSQIELATDARAELGMVLLRKISDYGDDEDQQKDYDEAKAVIRSALSLDARSPVAITARGMLAMEDGDCDEALPSYAKAKELDPNEVRAMDGFARCSRQLGRMGDMIAELKKILTIDPGPSPENAHHQQLIGLGYLVLGDAAAAKIWFDRAGAGTGDIEDANASPLDPTEWRHIYLIACAELLGDKAEAARLLGAYEKRYPNRSVWRLGTYFTRALYRQPGSQKFLAALEASGMPRYLSDETHDFHVNEKASNNAGNDFEPTPTRLTGGEVVTTDALRLRLAANRKPILLDVGRGACVIPGAEWVWSQGLWSDRDTAMLQVIRRDEANSDGTIVIMGDNMLGWDSYNAARFLIANVHLAVLWYRGGEEAWAAHGLCHDSDDRRPM